VFAYNKVTKRVVARLKFGFGAHLAKPLARLLVQAGADITSDADIVVPVPMHTYSLLKRKYNQAALLAFYFAAHYKLPVNTNALRKVRYTAAQRTKSRAGRQRNLRGSFKCSPQVRNMTVILVDDVITTGATIKECSKALLKAGAKEVRALSLARTLVRNR
jgi:ComF family protein